MGWGYTTICQWWYQIIVGCLNILTGQPGRGICQNRSNLYDHHENNNKCHINREFLHWFVKIVITIKIPIPYLVVYAYIYNHDHLVKSSFYRLNSVEVVGRIDWKEKNEMDGIEQI